MTPLLPDAAWLRRLKLRLDRPPVRRRARLDLACAGRPSVAEIGSIEPALATGLAGAGLPLHKAGATWRIELARDADIDPTFAAIARWLHTNGLAAAWRDELLSIMDANGADVGRIERAAVRPLGIATHAVHLVALDARGHVWVQQRALDKATDPGLWDTAMGGLVAAGESSAQTLERESWEEAGLRCAELREVSPFGRFTVRRPVTEGYMVEHIDMFETVLPHGIVPVNQDGEVERFECLDLATLIERLRADAFTLEAGMILADWLVLRERDGR